MNANVLMPKAIVVASDSTPPSRPTSRMNTVKPRTSKEHLCAVGAAEVEEPSQEFPVRENPRESGELFAMFTPQDQNAIRDGLETK